MDACTSAKGFSVCLFPLIGAGVRKSYKTEIKGKIFFLLIGAGPKKSVNGNKEGKEKMKDKNLVPIDWCWC